MFARVSSRGLAIEIQGILEATFIEASLSSLREDCYEDLEWLLTFYIILSHLLLLPFINIS